MRNRLFVVVVAIFLLCSSGAALVWLRWSEEAAARAAIDSFESRDGQKEAELDIGAGVPKWKILGKPHSDLEYRVALRERFGIALDRVADCEPTPAMLAYVERYNATIRAYVDAKYGVDAVDNALKDAVAAPDDRRTKKG
jgi:hypothetical protein